MSDAQASFAERLEAVRGRIAAACARSGRDPAGVRILPVTKAFGPEAVEEAWACGLAAVGESRVQEAAQKKELCPSGVEWHLVGHLQRNKVRAAVRVFQRICAVDSERLLAALNDAAGEEGVALPVLLEVNVSGERSKFGFAPEQVPAALAAAARLPRVTVEGLMTVPPASRDPGEARPFFQRLRTLRDAWRDAAGVPLEELSMGMSDDFEIAVEEGATQVRLGAALFGPRRARQWRAGETETEDAP